MIGEIVVGDVDADDRWHALPAAAPQRGGTLRVPQDYPTIQNAVDAAKPGSLVLVAPGVYKEAVPSRPTNLVIRGLDRSRTVLDGEFVRDNGVKVLADGVAVENMTARNYKRNGFFWTGVTGYRGSYLDRDPQRRLRDLRVRLHLRAVRPRLRRRAAPTRASTSASAIPCHAVITDSISEWNGIGYSGTNAGGDLFVVRSVWRDNRVGIVPNSGTGEENPPQHGITIAGNTVYGNSNAKTAAIGIAQLAIGNGILVAGGNDNVVVRNLVYDHDLVGIGVIPLPEKVVNPDDPKAINFDARRNRVDGNVVSDSRVADLALVTSIDDAKDAGGNCFSGNRFSTSLPVNIEQLVPCGAHVVAGLRDRSRAVREAAHRGEAGRYRLPAGRASEAAQPPRHARRARCSGAPRRYRRADQVDLDTITTPTRPRRTRAKLDRAPVAQGIERRSSKPLAGGSNPPGRARY